MEVCPKPGHTIAHLKPERLLSPVELGIFDLPDSRRFEEVDLSLLTARTLGLFDLSSSPGNEDETDPIR
jgi:hypothetical protein